MDTKRTCPECNLIFEAPLPETGLLNCPLCNSVFAARLPTVPPAAVSPPAPATVASGKQVLRGVLAVAALLFLVGGLVYAYHLMDGIGHKTPGNPPPAVGQAESSRPTPQPTMGLESSAHPTPLLQTPTAQTRPSSRPPELQPVAIAKVLRQPLTLPERVNEAIDRGVAQLRKHYKGHDRYERYLALLGLTLLECGIPADDPSVRQMAAWIRTQERDLTQTYDLTLAILFLDRLGDPRDRPLIRTFGRRLLDGQLDCGAWTYSCLINNGQRPLYRSPRGPRIISWSNGSPLGAAPLRQRIAYRGDNSNTQFAILGLWVAQRHGVQSRSAILAAEQYFRTTQQSDGSWAYHPNTRNWRDSMTCAGLMSLAMRYGVINGQGRDIRPGQPLRVHDFAVQQGLRYLAQSLDKVAIVGDRISGVEARDPLYFLWSLERMAVIYDLKKIGNREWYPWAAEMLVETQRPDGAWTGLGEPVSTCFALLILKRSNFAHDLQLAVQEPPSRPVRDLGRPTIVQGRDAILGSTGKPPSTVAMPGTAGGVAPSNPLGPSIARTPNTGTKAEATGGVPELPSKK
jgi:hypothetical protein